MEKSDLRCLFCSKIFTLKHNVKRHIENIHSNTAKTKYTCYICSKNFKNKDNLKKHIYNNCSNDSRGVGRAPSKVVHCAMCGYKETKSVVLEHYHHEHDVSINISKISFVTTTEFEEWKNKIEKETVSKFIKFDSVKTQNSTTLYYRCHRDGNFKTRGKYIRRIKLLGSNKIQAYCPAKIDAKILQNGEVFVKYLPTHVGHSGELGRITLSKTDRINLAEKISKKIPFDEIINNVHNNIGEDNLNRIDLLTRKDLINIEKSFNLNTDSVRHSNDCLSVNAWIKQTRESGSDSVIRFYKDQGEISEKYSELNSEDFLLIIMNDAQLEMLSKYGNDCLCIDSTHGMNSYHFELTTVMVLDDLRQGFPCVFIFSNRSDAIVFSIVFDVLKNCMETLPTLKVFMSDMADVFYMAWLNIMGPVEYRLFCIWHVDRAWKKNISSKIKDQEKQNFVYKNLRTLMEELDKETFETMLTRFMKKLESDTDLMNFATYFNDYYYENRKSWAHCYRQYAGLNTNTHIESMHKILKYIYLKGKTVEQLDKSITALLKFVRDELFDRIIIINKGKITHNLSNIRRRHKNMLSLKCTPTLHDDGTWSITSSVNNDVYIINVSNLNCSCKLRCEKCAACIHAYSCTCIDSSVKWNMCKHIHLVCKQQLETLIQENEAQVAHNVDGERNFIITETVRDPRQNEEAVILTQLTKSAVTKTTVNVENYKAKLHQEFMAVLADISSPEECDVLHKALLPIRPTLAALKSTNGHDFPQTPDIAVGTIKNIEPP